MSSALDTTSKRGPCAKREVRCVIKAFDGRYAHGTNDCANPQQTCPRLPGEGYEKCKTICQQAGHAEIQALAKAKEMGINLKVGFSFASVYGHHWMCNACGEALRDAGINMVQIEMA